METHCATEIQRLQTQVIMYEEKEEYLLKEIAHIVSKSPSLDLLHRVSKLESRNFELQEDVSRALKDKKAMEKWLNFLMEDKVRIEEQHSHSKEELKEHALMLLTRMRLEYAKRNDELKIDYDTVVCERDILQEELNSLQKNSIDYSIHQELLCIKTENHSLIEENKELEDRISSLIEQKINVYPNDHIEAIEEDQSNVTNECKNYKERNDELKAEIECLKAEYGAVIREKDALKVDLDFLRSDVSRREDSEGQIFSAIDKLKRCNEVRSQELTMVIEEVGKKINENISYVAAYALIGFVLLVCMAMEMGNAAAFLLVGLVLLIIVIIA